jgi:predicted transposase YbfD/YdcC
MGDEADAMWVREMIEQGREDTQAAAARKFHNLSKRHRYDVAVLTAAGKFETWEIDANNRDQASRIATQEGAQVRSVNMVG